MRADLPADDSDETMGEIAVGGATWAEKVAVQDGASAASERFKRVGRRMVGLPVVRLDARRAIGPEVNVAVLDVLAQRFGRSNTRVGGDGLGDCEELVGDLGVSRDNVLERV